MGRRSEHSADTLRLMIIEASERIVADNGLSGLSAREIARSVGYSPGTIYNIFENLDDLILTIEGRMLDDLDERLASLPREGTPRDQLLRLAHAYLAFTTERPRLWNLLFEHHLPPTTTVPAWYQKKLDALMARLEGPLRALLPHADATVMVRSARVLWAGVHGITSLATADKLASVTTDTAVALVEDLVRNYLVGLQQQS